MSAERTLLAAVARADLALCGLRALWPVLIALTALTLLGAGRGRWP